jgi:glutamate-1-semialdehyde 2,1-aminomutase
MRVLAGGVSSGFRMAERPFPLFFTEAIGSRVVDADGHSYIDYVAGYGPVVLGHSDARVTEAVASAASRLQQVGGQHEAEVELAETLITHIPAFETIRFSVSGSEAVHASIRLARAVTGRRLVLKFSGHYHGWLDTIATDVNGAPAASGQPLSSIAEVLVAPWNEVAEVSRLFSERGEEIAAVIMEPIACNGGVIFPRPGYIELVRKLTSDSGSLLIFDEVITGFRLGLGGAQRRLGITPDLTVVAKAMANGFPISAFGGRRDLMALVAREPLMHAGTYNGGGTSVAAALATIAALEEPGFYEGLVARSKRLMEGLATLAKTHDLPFLVQGPGPVFFMWFIDLPRVETYEQHLVADYTLYARFAERLLAHGVRVIPNGRWYLTGAHSDDDISRTLAAVDVVMDELKDTIGRGFGA